MKGSTDMNKEQHINWNIAGRILSGEASDKESETFNIWLSKNKNQNEWESILKEMKNIDIALTHEKVDINKAWSNVSQRIKQKKPNKNIYFTISAIAASIIIILTLFLNPNQTLTTALQTVQTINSIEQIKLLDGSQIDINRNSTLSYPENFSANMRTVALTGEAFFEVNRDKERPFIIETNAIKVKVLGTSFNIKAYSNSLNEVIVKTGRVEVSMINGSTKPLILNAGDKATFSITNNSLVKVENKNKNFLSWKTKEIQFKNDKLSDAIKLIEEVYNVAINIPDDINAEKLTISATFDKITIEHILNTINKIHGIDLSYFPN